MTAKVTAKAKGKGKAPATAKEPITMKRSKKQNKITKMQVDDDESGSDSSMDGLLQVRKPNASRAHEQQQMKEEVKEEDNDLSAEDEFAVRIRERNSSPQSDDDGTSDSSDDEDDDDGGMKLSINNAYAEKFEAEQRALALQRQSSRQKNAKSKSDLSAFMRKFREEEDLRRQKELEGLNTINGDNDDADLLNAVADNLSDDEDDESSEMDEDEDEEGLQLTKDIDEQINRTLQLLEKKDPAVYNPENVFFTRSTSDDDEETSANETRSKPKITVKDVLLKQMVDDANGEEAVDDSNSKPLTYIEEQKRLKEAFLKNAGLTPSQRDEDNDDDDLFRVKIVDKNSAASKKDDDLQQQFEAHLAKSKKNIADPQEFLKYFMTEQWWRAKNPDKLPKWEQIHGDKTRVEEVENRYKDEGGSEVDEEDRADRFEKLWNLRFEQMEKESEDRHYTLPSIPRHIEDSVRKKDNKRKKERERKKEAKELEQTRKLEEIKKLKSLAKKEAMEKFKEVEKIGSAFNRENEKGNAVRQIMQFIAKGDWKEEEYDEMMAQLYNEEFYEQEEMNTEEIEQMKQEELGELVAEVEKHPSKFTSGSKASAAEAESLEKTRDILSDLHTSMQELNEEQSKAYAPIPFRYRNVKPDTYGLSIEDILTMDDKDLNRHISLKKLAPYISYNNENGDEEGEETGEQGTKWKGQWLGKASWQEMRATNPLPPSKRYAQVYKVQQAEKRQREVEKKRKVAAIVPLKAKPAESLSAAQKRRLRAKRLKTEENAS